MATYTKPTIINYNDNPPSNDGSEDIVNNLVDWDRHIDEIGDPIKTYADSINDETSSAFEALEDRAPVNVKDPDYGAVGDGVTDDTAAIQSAIAENRLIYFPAGTYLVTSTIDVNVESVYFIGDGGLASEILFNPTANDICFSVRKTDGSVYFRGGFSKLFFNSDDLTYEKTAIYLEDTSGIILNELTCHGDSFTSGWSDTGYGSVFLHTKGREFLVSKNLNLNTDLGIKIDLNPNVLRTQVLDADHFHFEDTFITVPTGADTPCVRVMDGVNLSNTIFDGKNPWVAPGGDGFEWIDSATDTIASFNLRFEGVRFEQAQDGTKYSFNIDKAGTNLLQNLSMEDCHTSVEANGIYLRNVRRATFANTLNNSTPGKVILNVDGTCQDVQSINCFWNESTTATITGMEVMWGLLKEATAAPLPESFHLIASKTDTWTQNGLSVFSAKKWAYAAEMANDGFYDLACSPANFMDAGILTVWAYEATPTQEGGIFGIDPTGVTILSSTTNVTTTLGTASNLNVGITSSRIRVENKLGVTVNIVISAEYKT